MKVDVAIIGGGPAGATAGTLLKKYAPDLDVVILEREKFPRDHVGESLLPMVPRILHEMGAWDKVEAANFPIKLGAAYRWGKMTDTELFYFRFLAWEKFTDLKRPGKYEGQRVPTTFHVERAVYDEILLDHAKEFGCKVYERAKVTRVLHSGDQVEGLMAQFEETGEEQKVEARYYVDASGAESLVRRALDIGVHSPTNLRNIAIWDYWQNAEWGEKIGTGTFIYVLSIGYGWLWYIPIGETRTSIGFVTSADYFKNSGKSTAQLYQEAVQKEPLVRELTKHAAPEGALKATKDWSFISDRLTGQNWFLVGDSAGFADPILSAGMTLAMSGARRVAYTILERERGNLDPVWLSREYERVQKRNTMNHIRFADYWYSANEQFIDLREYCSEIAKHAGLSLDAESAFAWLSTGGFTDELSGVPLLGTYSLSDIKTFTGRFADSKPHWKSRENNIFERNLEGAVQEPIALYNAGRIEKVECWKRGDSIWPLVLLYKAVFNALEKEKEIVPLSERFLFEMRKAGVQVNQKAKTVCMETLEGLIAEGWVKASHDPNVPTLELGTAST